MLGMGLCERMTIVGATDIYAYPAIKSRNTFGIPRQGRPNNPAREITHRGKGKKRTPSAELQNIRALQYPHLKKWGY